MGNIRVKVTTFGELLEQLNELDPTQLNQPIAFMDSKGSYFEVNCVVLNQQEIPNKAGNGYDRGSTYIETPTFKIKP